MTATLPTELLQKVFRFLPPQTVYGVIPRVCRRFRDASWDAIPGCPSGSVGIACDVLARRWDSQSVPFGIVLDRNLNGFECVDYRGEVVWTALKTRVVLTLSKAAETPPDRFDAVLESHIFDTPGSSSSAGKPPRRDRVKVAVSAIRIHLWSTLQRFAEVFADSKRIDDMRANGLVAMEALIRYAGKTHVREFALCGGCLDILSKLAPDVTADSVERLKAANDTKAKWHRNLPTLLQVFPSASSLVGLAFYDSKATKRVKLAASPKWSDIDYPAFSTRCASITSLEVSPSRYVDVDLLEILTMYPNLQTLRTISMDPVLHISQLTPLDMNFPSLKTLYLFFDSISLELAPADSGVSERAVEFASVVGHLFPNLSYLHINHTAGSQRAVSTLGVFFDQIFRAVPPHCTVLLAVPFLHQAFATVFRQVLHYWPSILHDWNADMPAKVRGEVLVE
ncbi:hypothetical protein HDU93_002191 [Gonapodya sp. JEL0774]|nr:hypothetical protein HDU93_002191 [Gonapodya sp. JEL0774]